MAAAAPAPSSGPRYAPHDPTLPKPWKGLVDGNTGYLYFWNPDTNVTQYERPDAGQLPGPPPLPKHFLLSSSVQVHRLPPGHLAHDHPQKQHSREDDKGGRKSDSRSSSHNQQHGTLDARGISHAASVQNGSCSVGLSGHKGSGLQNHESDTTHSSRLSAESYRRQHEITVSGKDVPAPFSTFEATGFSSEILKEVRYLLQKGANVVRCGLPVVLPFFEVHRAGFSMPTPIQAQTWPIALQGRDIVGIAKTGSGKTLGYLFPGFVHIKQLQNNNRVGPTALVLSPTRELATQINEEAVKFGRSSRISCTCLYGGAPKGPQLRDLDRGVDVVVATPGRLNDILEMRRISLRQVSYLVLDEADRMLDMGFEPQIRKIVKEIPTRRQTLMYTATWPKEVRNIASDLLVNPVQVYIGGIDELVANKAITQNIEVLAPMDKQRRLEQILRSQEPDARVIIFCTTKRMCDQLARSIDRQFGAVAIHGDKSQSERDWVLNQFRSGRAPILVATDVAARGLDIKDIRVVINYDFPTGVEDYVHRIGRTGRAGATGVAYTFFCDQDAKYASDLIKVLEKADQDVPEKLYDLAGRGGRGRGRFRRYRSGGSRDRSRLNGDKCNDSLYGGKGSRSNLTSLGGWSERRHNERESPGRYSRSGGHEADLRGSGRYDNTRQNGEKLSGRFRSPSPNRGHASRSRSHSRSHSGGFVSRSRSRSHERSWKQGRKRSRSVDRMVVDERHVVRRYSPVARSDAASLAPDQAGKDLPRSEKQSRPPAGDDTRKFNDDNRARLSNYPLEEEEEGMIRSDD